jgi:two-component system sensor histidine kinase KdpD
MIRADGGLRSAFGCVSVSVLRRDGATWRVESSAGDPVPASPDDAQVSVPLDTDTQLAVVGQDLGHEELAILQAFAGQLALAVERRRLRAEAAAAEGLVEANELRTALLAAVSHDLRTPLASIRRPSRACCRRTCVHGRRPLTALDDRRERTASRPGRHAGAGGQTGALQLVGAVLTRWCRALWSLGDVGDRVVVDVPETLPRVEADAALLERAVANVISNALYASPTDRPVRVFAGIGGGRVDLRVADEGPGIPVGQREEVFRPFQRLGDNPNGSGVGLGLAVAWLRQAMR